MTSARCGASGQQTAELRPKDKVLTVASGFISGCEPTGNHAVVEGQLEPPHCAPQPLPFTARTPIPLPADGVYESGVVKQLSFQGQSKPSLCPCPFPLTSYLTVHLTNHYLPVTCQVTFSSTVQQQQHLAGPVHRKALQKQEAEAARQQRMAPYSHVAEAALGAAAWNTTHSAGGAAPHRPGKSNNVAAE